jgi:hypothetical protein
MYPNPGSVSTGILGVVGDISEMERSVDFRSQTVLVVITSLAFLIPAFFSWRTHRLWHSCLFGVMALVCASYHFCSADMPQQLGMRMKCSTTATHILSHAFFMWVYFCFLQMAFLVMGPEDPHMQWLSVQAAPGSPSSTTPHHAPFDAVLMARIFPAVVLCLFHFLHASWDTEEIHWQSLLLNEMLLLVCSAGFWLHRSRQARAADVLIRFKYWHRLLHHGFIPAMMLFWIFCIMGFADFQALHTMWHVVVALFAVSLLRTVLLGESTSPSAKVFDLSPHNPNVAHVLLGSVALIVLPTAVIGASFDWCSSGEPHWPTISTATLCQPGGYFVAIVAVPAFTGVATVFWLIDSTAYGKTSWLQSFSMKPWEREDSSSSPQQLALGKRLGCVLGYGGSICGLLAALIMKGTPIQNVFNLFCSIMSLGLIMIAMALTVLSSDPSTQGYRFRRCYTILVCLPMMIFHMMLILVDQCLPTQHTIPHSVNALTEYIVVLLLSCWPLTWASEVQDTWQRNVSGNFNWPVTAWRFDKV